MEGLAFLLALLVGAMALVRFYGGKGANTFGPWGVSEKQDAR